MAGKLINVNYRPGQLNTLTRVSQELARVYRDARQGRISKTDGTRLAYMLHLLFNMLRDSDLELRIEALEREVQ